MKKRYIKVAAIQSAPILFDKASAMDKIAQMTREAAGQGAALIVFPEVFDLSEVTNSRFDFDVTGHYSRPDIFQLIVNDKKQEVVRTAGMS
ncbi:nitrilase-related carbon-nitrogen hydrolase [Paenibacillus thiaminolyticus]|uniref:CN hydrolase domain-containing protein n=1 Tax=Paenibacillus thiaminolyticus TaxID=49283 RepID=A0A3A3GE58_PANTH|nr:nitrilase-related carbon-nitrogen hydrolase [Paenibacillus thiaminolyticus]RJG22163.1 hypothetical protein DQX05_18940 [Paenibacillus thiaminolyticus]